MTSKGNVGAGYLWVPLDAPQEERDDRAKQHRAECYARYETRSDLAQTSARDAPIPPTEDDLEGVDEGGLAMSQHLVRERDRGLRKRKRVRPRVPDLPTSVANR